MLLRWLAGASHMVSADILLFAKPASARGRIRNASGLDLRKPRIRRNQTQSAGFPGRGGDCRLWEPDGRNRLVVFPSAAKCLVEGDQLNACRPPGDLALGFDFKPLSLGVEDVEEVCQTSFIALGRKLDCVKRGTAGAGKAVQATLLGVVTRNRLIYLLHGS